MPIDFAKLNSPEWKAKHRAEEDERSRLQEEKEARLLKAVDVCRANTDSLTACERQFVSRVNWLLRSFQCLTDAQESWLLDIAKSFDQSQPVLATH